MNFEEKLLTSNPSNLTTQLELQNVESSSDWHDAAQIFTVFEPAGANDFCEDEFTFININESNVCIFAIIFKK